MMRRVAMIVAVAALVPVALWLVLSRGRMTDAGMEARLTHLDDRLRKQDRTTEGFVAWYAANRKEFDRLREDTEKLRQGMETNAGILATLQKNQDQPQRVMARVQQIRQEVTQEVNGVRDTLNVEIRKGNAAAARLEERVARLEKSAAEIAGLFDDLKELLRGIQAELKALRAQAAPVPEPPAAATPENPPKAP
ncbi:MAG: hypothetical protein V1809_01745 [Planctomycetota bacterium]